MARGSQLVCRSCSNLFGAIPCRALLGWEIARPFLAVQVLLHFIRKNWIPSFRRPQYVPVLDDVGNEATSFTSLSTRFHSVELLTPSAFENVVSVYSR